MPTGTNPQQVQAPEPGPGLNTTMPLADPGTKTGPDSHGMPRISDVVHDPGSDQEDWKAKYERELAGRQGLDRRYQEDRTTWEKERTQLTETLRQIVGRLDKLEGGNAPTQPEPQAPPISDGNQQAPQQDSGDDVLVGIIAEMEAARYRDGLLYEYTQPGQPGEGLPLFRFRDNIPVVPPDVGADGQVDDAAQRKAIEAFIQGLRGLQGQTQQQTQQGLLQGYMPGSSPDTPPGPTAESIYEKFSDVMRVYGSDEFMNMTPEQQRQIEAEYYRLLETDAVKERHKGSTAPPRGVNDLYAELNKLSNRLKAVEGRNPLRGAA